MANASNITADSLIASSLEQATTQFADSLQHEFSYDDFALPAADLPLEPWREAFDRLVDCALGESQLTPAGEFVFELMITNFLRNRLGVLEWARQRSEVLSSPVASPVFITGHGRTGTTLLSYLLDQDPDTRSLLHWEASSPIPPPTTDTLYTDERIAAVAEMQRLAADSRPEMMAIHPEAPDGPTECVTLLAQAGRSMLFETQWNLPSYSEWYLNSPQHDGYNYHKVALQVLQSQAPGRWILKSPHHAIATPEILDIYPDARFIITHRDPAISLASVLNLITTFTGWSSDHDWSSYINSHWRQMWRDVIDRLAATRQNFADRFVDVLYADLMADPLGCVRGIYEQLGWEFTSATEAAMAAWLADNPQGKHGRHSYSLEGFGYSYGEIDEQFGDYISQFAIPTENR